MPENLRMDLERPGSNKRGEKADMGLFVHKPSWLMLRFFFFNPNCECVYMGALPYDIGLKSWQRHRSCPTHCLDKSWRLYKSDGIFNDARNAVIDLIGRDKRISEGMLEWVYSIGPQTPQRLRFIEGLEDILLTIKNILIREA